VSDSLGHNAITTLTIDVIGTNDLPVIASGAESSSLAELINTTGSPTHDTTQPAPTGTLNFTDVDLTDTHSVGVTLQSAAWSGGPNIPAATQADLLAALQTALHDSTNSGAGSIDWTFSIADKDLDFLGQGETLQVTYNVAVADSAGATSNIQTVTITVTGTNDVPVVTAAQATGDAIEGAAAPGPNLVTNGDFETGDFTGWSAGARSSVDELFVRGLWTADLGPTPQNSESHESLSQHIATTVGATYQITFFAARGVEFDPASIFTVDCNGTPIATLDSGSPLGFTEYTFTVTATGSDTVLSFEYRDNADVWRLDDVSVVATSVPVQRTATDTISFADADLNDTHSVPTVVFKSTTLVVGSGRRSAR
jgi:VCBS repeat-containing protein